MNAVTFDHRPLRIIEEQTREKPPSRKRIRLLWILDRDEPLPVEVASGKIPERYRHSLENACANHVFITSINLPESRRKPLPGFYSVCPASACRRRVVRKLHWP